MKRYLVLSLVLLLAIGAASCGGFPQKEPAPKEQGGGEISEAAPQEAPGEAPKDEVPIPAGAALYRGVVTEMSITEGSAVITLMQAPGTNFGAESIIVVLDSDTKSDFVIDDLSGGDYLAVYYGRPMGGPMPGEVRAISALKLPPADDCIVSGPVADVLPDSADKGSGCILLNQIIESGDVRVEVFYDAGTQLYLNLESIKPGDVISVFTDGVRKDGDPQQVRALEIRILQ